MILDYRSCIRISDGDILSVDANGITFSGGYIEFHECVANYYELHGGSGKCVGERDITSLYFQFYTSEKFVFLHFPTKSKMYELFSSHSATKRFHRLEATLNKFGFVTRDMS